MAIFDGIGKKVKDFSEVTKINSTISSKNREIDRLYQELGRQYFAQYGNSPDAPFSDLTATIRTRKEELDQLNNQVNMLKGMAPCPNCGAPVPAGSQFCSACGAQQPAPAAPQTPDGSVFCPNCGAAMPEGTKFCARCGSKIGS